MTTLQFADTHNLVAFFAKPAKSEGFEQVVDFLNASSIRYALTVNPTIYTSCTDCLPNATIFEELRGRAKDADTCSGCVGYKDGCKSTSGGIQFLCEKLVTWSSKKQECIVISTAEADNLSLFAYCAQVIWMRTQLLDYGYKYNKIPMYCDSKSTIAISCNPVQHSRTKHIDIRYHFIKEHVEKGTVELYFVRTEYQLADLFNKALPKERFEYLIHRIVIIMAQSQRPTDVHQDELCLPNKRYALMDANKKVDLENLLCLDESRILENILQNHPLRFSIAASSSVPWIYLGQTIFHLPQATDNNHDHFVPALKFFEMVPFYINNLDFTLELRSTLNFKTTSLLQPVHDRYHNLEDDVMIKSIFNTGKSKNIVGMKIPDWMITNEMKLTENYRLYVKVFGVDVPTTQSQSIESTQGTHRTTSAPRTPHPEIAEGESSAPRRSIVIRLCILPRRSTRLTPPTPIPTTDEVDDLVLQDTIQVSLAE
ncbi:hypothetical protein Tco_0661948 [Tanacetum coccineum]